ncbi:hypothetical protein [Geminocystis sp. CENA526]
MEITSCLAMTGRREFDRVWGIVGEGSIECEEVRSRDKISVNC